MPPAAISRSSTYFPKICGNIAPGHPSAFGPALLALLAVGCGAPEPNVTTLSVLTHELPGACAVTGDAAALVDYTLALTALGPFSASASGTAHLDLDAHDQELAFDPRTAGVDAIVTRDPSARGPSPLAAELTGHTERRAKAGIDVLLWPSGRTCALSEGAYPNGNAGQALGYASGAGLALVAGEDVNAVGGEQGSGPGSALVFDSERGDASLVPREGALRVPRAFATVSAFGDELLVAGGDNPLGSSTLDAAATAEVFSPDTRAFRTTLELTFRRTRHAAVTLAGSGETVLIGGIEPDSESGGAPPREIRLFEAVSPAHGSSISELAELSVGRVSPTALVLDDRRIFVGGGTSPGPDTAHPAGDPLGLVEYFSADAKSAVLYAELPARAPRTFAALPGGGVLSVASCRGDAPDCTCLTRSGAPCEPSDDERQPYVDAVWLDPEGTLEPVAFAREDGASCPTPTVPALVPGSDGAPWLISAGNADGAACLWRFEPWPSGATGGDAPLGPRFVPTQLALEPPPDPRVAPLSLGPDAFIWVAAGGATGVFGTRLGHRGPLTRDGELLSAPPNGVPRPTHLAPDHNPSPALGPLRRARATFDPNLFRLTLEPPAAPAPPLTVWVADTLYDDVTVSVSLVVPGGTSEPRPLFPVIFLGAQPFGDSACAWPAPSAASIAAGQLTLSAARHGNAVTLSTAGGTATQRCSLATGAIPVGVRAGTATTTLVSLLVERG